MSHMLLGFLGQETHADNIYMSTKPAFQKNVLSEQTDEKRVICDSIEDLIKNLSRLIFWTEKDCGGKQLEAIKVPLHACFPLIFL